MTIKERLSAAAPRLSEQTARSGEPPRARVVVLHVSEAWGGGVRTATIEYARSTPEFEHHLLYGAGRREFQSDVESSIFRTVTELPRGAVAARRAILATVARVHPGIVHAHSSWAGVHVRLAIRSTRHRRIFYSPHCFAMERTDLPALARSVFGAAESLLARNTDTIIACSPNELRTAQQLPSRTARYVPSVPRGGIRSEPRSPTTEIVGVGRISAQKDTDFFRAVLHRVRRELPGGSSAWIGGGHDYAAQARLENDGIAVSGWSSHDEALAALAGAGVYLHTARWEGFPITILEAVEMGVPVIARDVPSIRGAIATPGLHDATAVADAVVELLRGGETARANNLRAWREVLTENDPTTQHTALATAYRDAVDPRPIYVNGKWLSAQLGGMQRYAEEVTRRLAALDPRIHVIAPRGARTPDWLDPDRIVHSRMRGVTFEQLALPLRSRRALLLNFAGPAPLAKRNQLVTMHDVSFVRFPAAFTKRFAAWYRLLYGTFARRARFVTTVSEFSRSEISEVIRRAAKRLTVMPNGHEHVHDWAVPKNTITPDLTSRANEPFVLCLGNLAPNKNFAPTAQALSDAGIRTIVVGASGTKRVLNSDGGYPESDLLWLAGRLSDQELGYLFSRADALVFPSLYEGFGIPILEAQALGCPVVTSDRSSMPEVAGDAALFFDPEHPDEAARHIAALRADPELRARLVAAGRENARRYSWDGTAARILRLITSEARAIRQPPGVS